MRLSPIRPADLNPIPSDLYDDIRAGGAAGFDGFRIARGDGAMLGPWNASLHPAVGQPSRRPTQAAGATGMLPANVKEVAILVVAGFHGACHEIHAHLALAERLCMPLARASSLVANRKPADLSAAEAVAFEVAHRLCRGGSLPEPTWRLAVEAFGDLGAAQLIYLVGVYAFVSTTLDGFDPPASGGDGSPLSPP